jgi:Fuc2NAc and GlcNAc transferase
MSLEIVLVSAAFPLAVLFTGAVRRYAMRAGVLDVPNERSLHTKITPRGGGLSIAVLFLLGVAALVLAGEIPARLGVALFGGGLLVAGVGWWDDRKPLPASVRFTVHVLAAAWSLWWLGGFTSLSLGRWTLALGPAGWVIGLFGIVWATNLYNFMDGTDGLASSEAVTVGLAAGLLELGAGAWELAVLCWLLAAASAGFLVWNWPPAKVFMGDAGSGFLGFTFATLAVASDGQGALPLLGWALLLGVFLADATITLLRRMSEGEPWHKAHRTHAYQLAVQAGWSHGQVTLVVLGLNVVLALLAGAAWRWPELLPVTVTLGGAGLLMLHTAIVRRLSPGKLHQKLSRPVKRDC